MGGARIVPHLIYDDPASALEWLARAFGFRERIAARHALPDGRVARAQMDAAGALVTLGMPSVHGGSPTGDTSTMLYVYVDDVDGHYRRASASGATIVLPLEDRPWGDRTYQARDLEGHQWTFAQRVRDVALDACAHDHD